MPLVPDRLAYRELFPKKYRYEGGQLTEKLAGIIDTKKKITLTEAQNLTEPYSWQTLKNSYEQWLQQLRNIRDVPNKP